MSERFSAAQVEALAPDASSLSSARGLARTGGWVELGTSADPVAGVWGRCRGGGARPYQTCVDLSEPAYQCSCPSRKFPCKHALGLLLLWSAGSVPDAEPPDWVRQWHDRRAERAAAASRPTRRAPGQPPAPTQRRAAARRGEQRAERVASGLVELDGWLTDQIRGGIAGLDRAGYRHFDQVAARLVDAQAPGVASAVRRLAGVVGSGEDWPGRLLTELSLLGLLTSGYRRLTALPAELADTIRARVGFPVATDDVLAGPRQRDGWQVIGVRDDVGEQLTTRRAWLVGRTTGQPALVLSFAAMGQTLATDLVAGTTVEADLCYYPGAALRALVAQRHGAPEPLGEPAPVTDVRGALRGYARALAGDPWLLTWPVLVRGTLLPGPTWRLVDAAGDALALLGGAQPWPLLAAGGGEPITVAAECGPGGLRPLAGFRDGEVVLP